MSRPSLDTMLYWAARIWTSDARSNPYPEQAITEAVTIGYQESGPDGALQSLGNLIRDLQDIHDQLTKDVNREPDADPPF